MDSIFAVYRMICRVLKEMERRMKVGRATDIVGITREGTIEGYCPFISYPLLYLFDSCYVTCNFANLCGSRVVIVIV